MSADQAQQFLKRVWLDQPKSGHAFLAYFDGGHIFHDHHIAPPLLPALSRAAKQLIPNDGHDVYFAPTLFTANKRRKPQALPGRWLYADLDESDPHQLEDFIPTIAWQTSPGRYQALWRLTRPLQPHVLSALNQRVTYFTEADRGGWALTKVLRVPGTLSLKRDKRHRVKLLWDDGPSHDPRAIVDLTRNTSLPSSAATHPDRPMPTISNAARKRRVTLRAYRGKLPTRARKLLRTQAAPIGTRSERLWELENLLFDAGMTTEQVFYLVRATPWNKHRGKDSQLWAEVLKAEASPRAAKAKKPTTKPTPAKKLKTKTRTKTKKKRPPPPDAENDSPPPDSDEQPDDLPFISSEEAQTNPSLPPAWMVAGIWSQDAHGLLAGQAKAFKTTVALDLAISVASGTPFLNHFQIEETGPVLYINEENDPDEVEFHHEAILRSRSLALGGRVLNDEEIEVNFSKTVPLFFLHHWGFDLRNPDHLQALDRAIRKHEPSLVILDPFYRMAPGVDENSAKDVGAVLNPLLDLKQWHGVGILLIHHYHKQNMQFPRSGNERVSGSGVFGRWFQSAVYAERAPDDPTTIILNTEHRGAAPSPEMHVTFDLGTNWNSYEPSVWIPRDDEARIYSLLRKAIEASPDGSITVSEASERLGLTTNSVLTHARKAGMTIETKSGKRVISTTK